MTLRLLYLIVIRVFGWLALLGRALAWTALVAVSCAPAVRLGHRVGAVPWVNRPAPAYVPPPQPRPTAAFPRCRARQLAGPDRLGASLEEFVGHPAYGTAPLRDDLERFVFVLGGGEGEPLFGP